LQPIAKDEPFPSKSIHKGQVEEHQLMTEPCIIRLCSLWLNVLQSKKHSEGEPCEKQEVFKYNFASQCWIIQFFKKNYHNKNKNSAYWKHECLDKVKFTNENWQKNEYCCCFGNQVGENLPPYLQLQIIMLFNDLFKFWSCHKAIVFLWNFSYFPQQIDLIQLFYLLKYRWAIKRIALFAKNIAKPDVKELDWGIFVDLLVVISERFHL
jgi:hypothetical protein